MAALFRSTRTEIDFPRSYEKRRRNIARCHVSKIITRHDALPGGTDRDRPQLWSNCGYWLNRRHQRWHKQMPFEWSCRHSLSRPRSYHRWATWQRRNQLRPQTIWPVV